MQLKVLLNNVNLTDHLNVKILCTAAAGIAGLYTMHSLYRAAQLPPGPWGLPLLGRIPWIDVAHFEESEEAMRQKYGPICSFRAGQRLLILVSSAEMMRDMLKEDVFSGRLFADYAMEMTKGCGIIGVEGKTWSTQRRVALQVLRDFGFGKAASAEMIYNELDRIIESIDAKPNSVKTFALFTAMSNSVVGYLLFNRRYANEDARFNQFFKNLEAAFQEGASSSLPLLFPTFAPLLNHFSMSKSSKRAVESMQTFIEEEIAYRESQMSDPGAEALCLCDAYLRERQRAEARGDKETFKPFHTVRVAMEMFNAGTETTARSLEWLMLYMALNSGVQDKVHAELDSVVGRARRPEMKDKADLHYVQAVLDESLRFASLAFNSLPHRAIRTTTFRGYRIPDDAVIVPFIHGAHRDAAVWQRPDEFYPNHFLDSNGKYKPSKFLVPFSVGKRVCPGEGLANLEIFLAFTSVMQRFRVSLSEEFKDKVDDIVRGTTGIVRNAANHSIDFARR